jgi:formate/nitrite transporter FocA (FNT family)
VEKLAPRAITEAEVAVEQVAAQTRAQLLAQLRLSSLIAVAAGFACAGSVVIIVVGLTQSESMIAVAGRSPIPGAVFVLGLVVALWAGSAARAARAHALEVDALVGSSDEARGGSRVEGP